MMAPETRMAMEAKQMTNKQLRRELSWTAASQVFTDGEKLRRSILLNEREQRMTDGTWRNGQ
jgi:hypothetical protein